MQPASPDKYVRLTSLVDPTRVTANNSLREKLSRDEFRMSPVLKRSLPATVADVVVMPATIDEVVAVVRFAVQEGVPVTPRGRGTGNYGQAVPLQGGIVLDLSKLTGIESVEDDTVTALAGTRIIALEQHLRNDRRELTIFPSTLQSTIGGFLAGGSGGTGSIEHGFIEDGFVVSLDVVHPADGNVSTVTGDDILPYLHAYGTTGIIVRARVRHEPARDWVAVFASFTDFRMGQQALLQAALLEPAARIASVDMAELASTFRKGAPPAGHAGFRAVVDRQVLDELRSIIQNHHGAVDEVGEGLAAEFSISMLSYNHPSWLFIEASDEEYFHVEAGGRAMIDRLDEVLEVWPGTLMHLDACRPEPLGMLTAPFTSREDIDAGIARLGALGVGAHSPHDWRLDRRVDLVRARAAATDPTGILNPGRY